MSSDRYLPIDEEGYFVFDGRRVEDEEMGRQLLKAIRKTDGSTYQTSMNGESAWVENFDAPLIARHVRKAAPGEGEIDLSYVSTARFGFDSLSVDEWDRFHGVTREGVSFVFSRGAQVEFFDLLEEFDDDSVTIDGKRYAVPAWLNPAEDVNKEKFWSDIYRNEKPGWEHERESVILPQVLPQLKLSKSRVLVLGAGSGNDAAYFARQGHAVTAVDFSPEALKQAKAKYGDLENLKFEQHDAFALPASYTGRFDLVFEHTLYCAINPARRNELVKTWRRCLQSEGHLLGVFFVFDKRVGPPFGGSEWEVRERLRKGFDFLFWTRWRHSLESRKGRELVVYARKRASN